MKNINYILKVIPHRYPFLLIDRIEDKKEKKEITTLKNVTFNEHFFLLSILLIQALTVSPFTSISQAPQLPVRQQVGISKPAFSAVENQSSPSEAYVSLLFGHLILISNLE